MSDSNGLLADLLARTALRDTQAFHRLYELTAPALYAVLLPLVRGSAVAEAILQECYIAVWLHAGSYVPAISRPATWLLSIARHRAFDYLRSAVAPPAPAPAEAGLAGLPARLEQVQPPALRTGLAAMDANVRASLVAAYFTGATAQQLAAQRTLPSATVTGWLRRGLQQLRQAVDGAAETRTPRP